MNNPLVSIVTVTRNRDDLISRCINSIQKQTYKNFEHIIIDGASSDNTEAVVLSFQDERIKYVKMTEANSGYKSCFDEACRLAHGKYLSFLDDDDEYKPEKIEKQVSLMETLPEEYGLVYCWMTYYDTKTGKEIRLHNPSLRGDVHESVVARPIVSGTPTFLMRTHLFTDTGGWLPQDLTGIISDWAFAANLCQKYKVDFVPESLVNVYINHSGAVRMSAQGYYKEMDYKLIKFHNYFLDTYKEIFKKHPKSALYHYSGLADSYMHLHSFKLGLKYYLNMLLCSPSLKQILRPLYRIIK